MQKGRFMEEQIVAALKLAQASSVDEVCRKVGINPNTFHALEEEVRRDGRERREEAQAGAV